MHQANVIMNIVGDQIVGRPSVLSTLTRLLCYMSHIMQHTAHCVGERSGGRQTACYSVSGRCVLTQRKRFMASHKRHGVSNIRQIDNLFSTLFKVTPRKNYNCVLMVIFM